MPVPTIEWKDNRLRVIDQTLLPHKLKFVDCDSAKMVWGVIKNMRTRGAPALGVAAAFGVYLGVRRSKKSIFRDLDRTIQYLSSSRPTARNLFWSLERMKKTAYAHRGKPVQRIKSVLLEEAKRILEEDRAVCRKIGMLGSRLIGDNDNILTHCNAGGLATGDYGTALGVLFAAHSQGKRIKVYVDETRPLLQGSRLTAWELLREKIDTVLICDNMAASLMAAGKIDKIVVGADRIAKNGDTANKIGTYNLALLAHYHKIPFYVAAPLSTIDVNMKSGEGIPIENRQPDEVRKIGNVYIAPKKVDVFNPAFDVTPNKFVTAFITEAGILRKPFTASIKKAFSI
ncbi:MAG: S-methyl-5-thioribose-1-phosphate isomerase [Omnitrophica bacterium RBG_13_46_9]|nr:MAG: S-methyl-5-thioribose-1-phosphate isomerase [Omnitrophica bacterium RBG_13_46_9]